MADINRLFQRFSLKTVCIIVYYSIIFKTTPCPVNSPPKRYNVRLNR